jgi:hypothetical protein
MCALAMVIPIQALPLLAEPALAHNLKVTSAGVGFLNVNSSFLSKGKAGLFRKYRRSVQPIYCPLIIVSLDVM